MSVYPATTVKVTNVQPCGDGSKVCIQMEMIVDVNRMAEVASKMLSASVDQMKAQDKTRKRK
jgi:hypothetical protein